MKPQGQVSDSTLERVVFSRRHEGAGDQAAHRRRLRTHAHQLGEVATELDDHFLVDGIPS